MSQQPEQPLLKIDNVSRIFHIRQGFNVTRLEAVLNASLTLISDKPEIYALAGESGSGKTTLARMVLGLERPSDGRLEYKGRDIARLSARDKRRWFYREVQPVFQDPFATFSPMKPIESYLYETVRNYKIAKGEQVVQRIDEALGVVGLSHAEIRNRYPNELSGGQAQRISIARALITGPSLLVADEPVSMLDASLRMSILNLFKRLRDEQRVSVLYITHDLATAYYTADRIGVMLRGWIVENGPVEQVLGEPLHPYTQLLKSSVPQADPEKAWTVEEHTPPPPVVFPVRGGCKFAARCPKVMDRCRAEIPADYEVDGRSVKCFLYEQPVRQDPHPEVAARAE